MGRLLTFVRGLNRVLMQNRDGEQIFIDQKVFWFIKTLLK